MCPLGSSGFRTMHQNLLWKNAPQHSFLFHCRKNKLNTTWIYFGGWWVENPNKFETKFNSKAILLICLQRFNPQLQQSWKWWIFKILLQLNCCVYIFCVCLLGGKGRKGRRKGKKGQGREGKEGGRKETEGKEEVKDEGKAVKPLWDKVHC